MLECSSPRQRREVVAKREAQRRLQQCRKAHMGLQRCKRHKVVVATHR